MYLKLIIVAVFLIGGLSSNVKADPLTFSNVGALQNAGLKTIDLLSSPNLVGPAVTFRVDISGNLPPGGTDTLLVVYSDATGITITQTFEIPLIASPPFTLLFTVASPNVSFSGTPATLSLNLLNSNSDFIIPTTGQSRDAFTYNFTLSQPVPEPASMALLLSGLSSFGVYRRMRRPKTKEAEAHLRNGP
jgi:hypothetical protein